MAQELSPGARLSGGSYGGYTIDGVLGRGGFGVTYTAHSQIGIQFAIKEFFPKNTCERDTASNDIIITDFSKIDLIGRLRQRFLDEAENLKNCEHDNIVHVVESFVENGTAYMVMENVEGVTLQKCVANNGPMSEEIARDIIIKAALALHYLHNRRITHLDIKPDNIILTGPGEPIIIDFGLSRQHTAGNTAVGQQLTAISKGYTAREQYSRQNAFLPQSDIYSLAATYYFLLTGRRPAEPAPNHNYAAELPDHVSDASRYAIHNAMQYDPRRRTRAMTSFIGELRGIIHEKEVLPPKSKTEQKSSAWWNVLSAIVLAACIANILGYSSAGSMKSNFLFHMNLDEFIGILAGSAAFAFVSLLIKSRGVKIFFSLIAFAAALLALINFHMS